MLKKKKINGFDRTNLKRMQADTLPFTRRMMFRQKSIKLTDGKEYRIIYGSIRLTGS